MQKIPLDVYYLICCKSKPDADYYIDGNIEEKILVLGQRNNHSQ